MRHEVTAANFSDEIVSALKKYTQEVREDIKKATDDAAKKLVKSLKKTSPNKSGAYAKDWRHKKETDKNDIYRQVVYNKKHYQLTHLLENGHKKGGKNQKADVKAIPHIEPNYEQIEREFGRAITDAIKRHN